MEFSDKQIQIIEAAEKLFSDKGYNATSVRDIAQEANINLAMISYYFGSKDKLLESVFAYRTAAARIKLASLIEDKKMTPLNKLYELIELMIKKVMHNLCFHRIMVREQMMNTDTPVMHYINELKKQHFLLIKEIVAEGQRKGTFKKNIDTALMMTTISGTLNQLISSQKFYKEVNGLQDLSEEEFQKYLKKRLSVHFKSLLKVMLTNETSI